MEVQKNMPAPGPALLASALLPGEHKDIRVDIQELLSNADNWLATPNVKFLGRRPLDLIGTPDEQLLRDTLRSALYATFRKPVLRRAYSVRAIRDCLSS